jgi:hypothetical protein
VKVDGNAQESVVEMQSRIMSDLIEKETIKSVLESVEKKVEDVE